MRAIITSDLHLGVSRVESIHAMVARALQEMGGPADVLMVLGDIGDGAGPFDLCLEMLTPLAERRFCVVGNHDLYELMGYRTNDLKRNILPASAVKHGFEHGPKVTRIGTTVFMTNSCWHNLTWRSPLLPKRAYRYVEFEYWKELRDGRTLGVGYEQLHREDIKDFHVQLDEVDRILQSGDTIVVGSHWPIVREVYVPYVPMEKRSLVDLSDEDQARSYATVTDAAFMSPEFGDMLFKRLSTMSRRRWDTKVPSRVLFFSGHTHHGNHVAFEKVCPVEATIVQSNYNYPGFVVVELP